MVTTPTSCCVQAGQAAALDRAKGASDKANNNTVCVNASLGSKSSTSTSHLESETTAGSSLSAGNNVTVTATGTDITVAGSRIKAGKDVTLDAHRDVNLVASQDTQLTTRKNNSGGSSIGAGVGGMASANINAIWDKMTSDYDSVQEESGILAGSGGFDVKVGNHTHLDGGVIASTATADKNTLYTGTLGFSDIDSRADFKTDQSRDTEHANGSISPIFDQVQPRVFLPDSVST